MKFNLTHGSAYMMRVYEGDTTDAFAFFAARGLVPYFRSTYGKDELGWDSSLPRYKDGSVPGNARCGAIRVRSMDDISDMPPFCETMPDEPGVCYGMSDPFCTFAGTDWPWLKGADVFVPLPGTCHAKWDAKGLAVRCGLPRTTYFLLRYDGATGAVELGASSAWYVYDAWDAKTGKCVGSIDPAVAAKWGSAAAADVGGGGRGRALANVGKNSLAGQLADDSGPGVGTVLVVGGTLALGGAAVWYFWPQIKRAFG